jgi:hypothetical protein
LYFHFLKIIYVARETVFSLVAIKLLLLLPRLPVLKNILINFTDIFPLLNRKRKYFRLMSSGSVAEPHHFYPAPGENFDAAPAPAAPAHTLQYSKAKFLK